MKRAKRICQYPGCTRLCDGAYCEEHQPERVDLRQGAGARGYDYSWHKFRNYYLSLPQNQICSLQISRRCSGKAECIDHIVPLSMGGAKYDEDNLQPCCNACNVAKGRRVIRGTHRLNLKD